MYFPFSLFHLVEVFSVMFAVWFPWFNIAKQQLPPPYFQMFTEVNFPMAASSRQRPLAETAF